MKTYKFNIIENIIFLYYYTDNSLFLLLNHIFNKRNQLLTPIYICTLYQKDLKEPIMKIIMIALSNRNAYACT